MAGKRKGLGKGLDSLIQDKKSTPQRQNIRSDGGGIGFNENEQIVNINDIEPNRSQPRIHFEEDALLELAESIKQFGVLQPILVQKRKDYYEIIAGERRWRAAKQAGLKKVPVLVRDYSEKEIVEISIIENIQRENLNPIEEALAYKRLMEEFSMKQDEVAERVAKSRTAVTNIVRLLKLSEKVQQMLVDDMISMGHARALLAVEDPEQQYVLAMQVFDRKMSVREIEKIIKKEKNAKKKQKNFKPTPSNEFVYQELAEKMKQALGTKVSVKSKGKNKGVIEVEYYSDKELERLYDLICRE